MILVTKPISQGFTIRKGSTKDLQGQFLSCQTNEQTSPTQKGPGCGGSCTGRGGRPTYKQTGRHKQTSANCAG
uniref:Uncharacterized protein n=1 Tax=Triticum urartu TaxID=4572 RepID=A0A8R7USY8_TRIUA